MFSFVGQGQLLLLTGPRLPCRSYKAIYSWFLPVLYLVVHGTGHAVNRLIIANTGPGAALQKPWGHSVQGNLETYCCLPAVHKT